MLSEYLCESSEKEWINEWCSLSQQEWISECLLSNDRSLFAPDLGDTCTPHCSPWNLNTSFFGPYQWSLWISEESCSRSHLSSPWTVQYKGFSFKTCRCHWDLNPYNPTSPSQNGITHLWFLQCSSQSARLVLPCSQMNKTGNWLSSSSMRSQVIHNYLSLFPRAQTAPSFCAKSRKHQASHCWENFNSPRHLSPTVLRDKGQ